MKGSSAGQSFGDRLLSARWVGSLSPSSGHDEEALEKRSAVGESG